MTDEANTCVEILRKAARFGVMDCQLCPAYSVCPTGTAGWNNECMLETAANLIASLSEELEQVQRERDAAVNDLQMVCRTVSYCFCCKSRDEEYVSNDCMDCINGCNRQWRGVRNDE